MTAAGGALPELIRWPRVPWEGVLQIHLAATSLATNADVGMVHSEILVHQRRAVTRERSELSLRSDVGGGL